ncbi:MAG TPA: 3'-5' exonuclease, partial [Candidatus Binatia bacterium]|nr:3'-5' exonuclease [Candidatus Binatia bacterium]
SRPDDDPGGRSDNVKELVTVAQLFDEEFGAMVSTPDDPLPPPLVAFLERLALAADVDDYQNREQAVTLMTVHNSKGLEFGHVFLIGMEEGIFPHSRSVDEEGRGVEEERRLCYVGMTRAMQRLWMTHARRRHVFGSTQYNFSSRFLDELPTPLLVHERSNLERGEIDQPRVPRGGAAYADDFHDDYQESWVRPMPAPARAPAGISTRVAPAAAAAGRYKPGMRVVHPMFGVGTVRESDGSGEAEKLIVQFQRYGVKKLVAHLARLEIVA